MASDKLAAFNNLTHLSLGAYDHLESEGPSGNQACVYHSPQRGKGLSK